MSSCFDPVHVEAVRSQVRPSPYRCRPVIGEWDGSSTLAWHMEVPPSECGQAYVLTRCDEIVVLVAGAGTAVLADAPVAVGAGHSWLVRPGMERCFRNTSCTEAAVLVGFCPGAPDFVAAGYHRPGTTGPMDGRSAATGGSGAIVVHPDEVPPERMDAAEGWSITDFRLPLGRHNGSSTTLFRARFLPGAVHRKHRHERCEEIYYVISGHGVAGAGDRRNAVRGGHFHFIPAGTEHWLVNRDAGEPVEVVGVYVDAGSVDDTGYVYCGDVTTADLE